MTAVAVFVLDRGYRWLVIGAAAATAFIVLTLVTARRDRRNHRNWKDHR